AASDDLESLALKSPALQYTFRHGDRSAEVLSAEILDATGGAVDLVETGDPLVARMRVRFKRDIEEPLFGFLIRNRLGLHAYGANSEQKGLRFGTVSEGEVVEVSFSFDCWLGTDLYSVSFAVHSADGVSYDWLDGVSFFRVASSAPVEGIANLNATAESRRLGRVPGGAREEEVGARGG
ncbi:MAG TPA: Wzt carbohydrate-binding domain-containing protein, partial [Pyrinomonadaceae bacterium]